MITEKLTIKLSVNKLLSYVSIEQSLVSNLEHLTSSKGRNGARDLISGCGFRSKNFRTLCAQSCPFFSKILATPLLDMQ